MTARYAIYLAPPADSDLWRFGSRALGRDVITNEAPTDFAPQGYDRERWAAVTADARRYGFHATLKAPFRLAKGATEADLAGAVAILAREFAPFDLPLRMAQIPASPGYAFVALRPRERSAALERLEAAVVRRLDRFRAPLSAQELAKRGPDRLTPRQREYLDAWGYPYVLDEFRLHFTLSGAVAEADGLAAALEREWLKAAATVFRVDALTLFVEPTTGADFLAKERFSLGGE